MRPPWPGNRGPAFPCRPIDGILEADTGGGGQRDSGRWCPGSFGPCAGMFSAYRLGAMSRRTEDDHPQQRTLWYTRRGVSIRGPFPEELVRRYVLLGRLGEDDEVSRDCTFWEPLSAHPELIPELVIEARTSDEARERLMATRLLEDARDVSERRGEGVSESARSAPEATHGERRGGGQRRGPEPDWMVR